MKKVGHKIWGFLATMLLLVSAMTGIVNSSQAKAADETENQKATIILHKKKMTTLPAHTIQNTGSPMNEFDNYEGLPGVEFKIYDVTEAFYAARAEGASVNDAKIDQNVMGPKAGVAPKDADPIRVGVTDGDGNLSFAGLPKKSGDHDAVYVIVETPKDGVTVAANMVVAFPVYEMNADGTYTDNELNTIHLYPKNTVSVDGSMKLTKTGSHDEKLNGAQFIISKKELGVTKYLSGVKDGLYIWTTDKSAAKKFVTGFTYGIGDNNFTTKTGNKGELIVNGLEVGSYKITEVVAPDHANMIDGETVNDFTVTKDNNSDKPVLVDVKNDTAPEITKKIEDEDGIHDYNVGDLIKYTITVKIPDGIANTEGDVYNKFNIVDKHAAALTYVKGAAGESLTVDGQAIDFDVNPINDDNFTVIPNLDQLKKYAGKTLTFTYYMKLNDKANPDVNYENTAELDTDPGFDNKPTPPVDVITGGKRFVKVDGASEDKLAGAQFVVRDANSDTAKYLKIDETTKEVTWVTSEAEATKFETESDGLVDVSGLDYGTYYLEEIKAPTDFVKLTKRIEFTVAEGSYGKPGELVNPLEVANTHKGSLPSTGGKGIIAFVIVGLVAIAGAITYFVRSRKHAEI